MITREFLKEHYNNIFIKNKETIIKGGEKDTFLEDAENDNRMSLCVLIRISPDISNNIEKCINKIKEIESNNLYYYPISDFHITVIDILKGEIGRNIPQNINDYINCINEVVKQIKPFNIEFDGITASNNAILVKGFYDNELQKFRENLRENLKKKNLKLEERFKTISSHITIARVKNEFKYPDKLISFINEQNYFGKMEIKSMELTFHNWYDTKKQIITKFNL